jgi:hypothetical protein
MSTIAADASGTTAVWAAAVAGHARLPDRRLVARLADVLACLAAKPADSIPQATGDRYRAKATYRFLASDRVTPEALVQSYARATAAALRGLSVVYVIHDSTSLNYSSLKQTAGLGPINDSPFGRGLHLHTSLAVRPDGVVLGLLHQRYWARPATKAAVPSPQRPAEQRESIKWVEGVRAAAAAVAALPAGERPRLIHVMDREGDATDVFRAVVDGPDGLVLRGQYDRRVTNAPGSVGAVLAAAAGLGEYGVAVAARPGRSARAATLVVRSAVVTLDPASRATTAGDTPLTFAVVEAREAASPADGAEPLHWRLWTTEPAATLAAARAVVGIYELRPRVEDFHLTLKSGCRVEQLELETAERLQKALAIYSGIAARILGLRDLARREPAASCTAVLSDDEWRVLWALRHGEPPPPTTAPPTLAEAAAWLGRLGGHLGRKCDGPPGVRTLWRGWRDLQLVVLGYRAARGIVAGT